MKNPVRRSCLLVLFLCGTLLPVPRSFGASQMFLKLSGIDGESTDKSHPNEIIALGFSQAVNTTNSPTGARATFSDLNVIKTVDKSTPLLFLNAAQGNHITQAVLTVRNSGATPLDYYQITLTDVLITSVQTSGSSGGDRPTESITLNFAKIEWRYIPQNADGSTGMPVVTTWNVAGNTP